jgi:hypothetical protein
MTKRYKLELTSTVKYLYDLIPLTEIVFSQRKEFREFNS